MGRIKKIKKNIVERNRLNSAKRFSKDISGVQSTSLEESETEPRPRPMPGSSIQVTGQPSTSVRANVDEGRPNEKNDKPTGFALYKSYNETFETNATAPSYIMVDVALLKSFICQFPCSECFSKTLEVKNEYSKGYANFFKLHCNSCLAETVFQTSRQAGHSTANSTRAPYDINRRLAHAFTSLGKGHRGMEVFSMHLNMKPLNVKAYHRHLDQSHTTYLEAADAILENARSEVRKAYLTLENLPVDHVGPLDITVSYDGSWQKRGFTSKNGVGCVVDVVTGVVIDFEVLTKHCRQCEKMKRILGAESDAYQNWVVTHKDKCDRNYEGSSPNMEVVAAERMWKRSQDHGFRYTTVVSDGDSKTFVHLSENNPYDGVKLEKVECLNHVAKRLGTGLRKIVTDNTGKGDPLGGKKYGSLKASTIDKLTTYYRNAIEKNLGDIKEMKTAIYATIYHCKSTDEKPQHQKCPKGKESWCFYNRALANNENPDSHKKMIKTPITEKVAMKIMPLYQRLAADALLERCVSGKTQNANEALHGVIWSKCPKTSFASRKRLEICVCEAICQYNTGCNKSIFTIQAKSGISPGVATSKIAKRLDGKRLELSKVRKVLKFTAYRKKLRQAQLLEEERRMQKEGLTYGRGSF